MSDSSDEDDQRKAGCSSRMWAESQPGPSRCQPSRQGYCGYCRVLYANLDQHLSSLRHLDSVRASSRGSGAVSSSGVGRTKLTLLERFLQDVLQHHPHHYNDPRPSHADLPSVSTPLLPRAELDDLRFCDDSRSRGTRDHLPSSDDASSHLANRQEDDGTDGQSGEGVAAGVVQDRLSAPMREQENLGSELTGHESSPRLQALPPPHQAPPSVHRKAHRKTNRRKTSESSASLPPPSTKLHKDFSPVQGTGTGPPPVPRPADLRPWLSWQKERRKTQKEEAFSSDPLDQTIEEVIQTCCYGVTSTPHLQEEMESLHLSLPVSAETQSDDWDSPVQVVLQQARALSDTPVQVSRTEGRDLCCLMDSQVDLEDQVYSCQLDSALHGKRRAEGGAAQGFWSLPIEEILPAPAHIPESFRGKTWAQIEQEDEEKVEKLVRQFRRGRFICYFDSESLARYGRRRQDKKGCGDGGEVGPNTDVLPLLDCDDDDSGGGRRRKRRGFRVASRCQVVKVSHATQTVRLVVPAVRQPGPPTGVPAANREAAERTPEAQTWRCLPPAYSGIVTPVQPRTSLVYLLCSPSGPPPTCTPAPGSAPKRCRKKRRPLDLQGLKVKYKQLPVRFYNPGTNRILKNPPKDLLWRRGPAPSLPPCVRQLFRSLSPDLNTDRAPGEGAAGSSRVKGRTSADPPFGRGNGFLLSAIGGARTRDAVGRRGRTSKTPPPPERGRGGKKDGTRPPPSKRRTRAEASTPQPRREGPRRAGPGRNVPAILTSAPVRPPPPRRGRARRGRACKRGRR